MRDQEEGPEGEPLPKGKSANTSAFKTSSAVDKRSLLDQVRAAALLGWVYGRPRGGRRLHAFFATMYYAGARPEEVVALDVGDVRLPARDAEERRIGPAGELPGPVAPTSA
ncbi:hypothetical protein ABZ990_17755 [Streptomyces sp. NPDC046203]|uniref:hypothetical protein n=1 Tax=Streptomyces sp. NPDC046203 TaxID=3154602 RepID=UPI003409691E